MVLELVVAEETVGIYIFFWAVKSEQFDDLEKQGMSILFDENKKDSIKKDNESKIQD